MSLRTVLLGATSCWAVLVGAALAQSAPAGSDPTPPGSATPGGAVSEVVVTATRLNAARLSIEPSLGATTYTVTNAQIQALPGGDNQQLNQVILQLPGVSQDGFGQFHVRDDHNNLQYRVNGVILPEGVAVFGQTLSPRLIEKLDLITGALPAQYGLRTAGIVDITTKSGLFNNGGQISIYGGSHGLYEPSVEYGGHSGNTNFFVSADFRRSQLGIENPDASSEATHDRTDQGQVFAYLDHILSPNDRVSFLGGYSNQRFQIPNTPGLQPNGTYTLNGQTAFPSELLNERQREVTGFAQASFLHDQGPFTLQSSLFGRYSTLSFRPDATGDLLYTGQAPRAEKEDAAFGAQIEGVYRLTPAHTLRGGVIIQAERGITRTSTQVFPTDANGAPTTDVPIAIRDKSGKTQTTYSVYLQDEWKILSSLTLNFGGRYDRYEGYGTDDEFSPRVNVVYQPFQGTTFHAGYAHYFTPPPFELVGIQTVNLFVNTSAASASTIDTTPFAERTDYYDVGLQQKVAQVPGLTLGIDAFDRRSSRLIDEGQFGAPIVLTPFNYKNGKIRGVELSANYAHGPWLAYANVSYDRAQGRNIISSQFNFNPDDLAYIANHYIFLDHDQTYTTSAGLFYNFREGFLNKTQVGGSMLYGSGLRKGGDVPNGDSVPSYTQVNLTASHTFELPRFGSLQARFDIINVGDEVYLIRDGTGVGVGAPQHGPRRGFFAGVTKTF